jgi:hypothetical protein
MRTNSQRAMAPLSGLDRPPRPRSLSSSELNLLARKISRIDRVTFAIAHEQIESFMGGVNLAAPRSGIKGLNHGALPARRDGWRIHISSHSD